MPPFVAAVTSSECSLSIDIKIVFGCRSSFRQKHQRVLSSFGFFCRVATFGRAVRTFAHSLHRVFREIEKVNLILFSLRREIFLIVAIEESR